MFVAVLCPRNVAVMRNLRDVLETFRATLLAWDFAERGQAHLQYPFCMILIVTANADTAFTEAFVLLIFSLIALTGSV